MRSRFLNSEEENDMKIEIFERRFQYLLGFVDIPLINNDLDNFWLEMTNDNDLGLIAQIAIRLLIMPCSEATVERMFSHLKYLYGPRNQDSSPELINAEMAIKMQQFYKQKNKEEKENIQG